MRNTQIQRARSPVWSSPVLNRSSSLLSFGQWGCSFCSICLSEDDKSSASPSAVELQHLENIAEEREGRFDHFAARPSGSFRGHSLFVDECQTLALPGGRSLVESLDSRGEPDRAGGHSSMEPVSRVISQLGFFSLASIARLFLNSGTSTGGPSWDEFARASYRGQVGVATHHALASASGRSVPSRRGRNS